MIIMPSGAGEESDVYQAKIIFGTTEGRDQTLNLLADTGSSWTWVKSCDKSQYPYWDSHTCPDYYFDEAASSSLTCTDKQKFIRYGSGSVNGQECEDYLRVFNTASMSVKMPFLLDKMAKDLSNQIMQQFNLAYDGILGLSPSDDSSGPLFIDYLYSEDKIQSKVFSILPGNLHDEKKSKITFGGYQKEEITGADQQLFYKEDLNQITAHRV